MVHEKLTHYSILILFLPHTEKGCLQDLENRTANQNENGSRMLKGMTGILCPKKPPSHPNLFSTCFNFFQLVSTFFNCSVFLVLAEDRLEDAVFR